MICSQFTVGRGTDYTVYVVSRAVEQKLRRGGGGSVRGQTEDDSEISNSLHASLALVHVDLTDSPPPMQAVTLWGWWE